MAKKRALVDGAIALARVSDMFKQDLDDLAQQDEPPAEPPKKATKKAEKEPPVEKPPLSDADKMILECERGFVSWDAKVQWSVANKGKKEALPAPDQRRVEDAFRKAHPTSKPTEPIVDAEEA